MLQHFCRLRQNADLSGMQRIIRITLRRAMPLALSLFAVSQLHAQSTPQLLPNYHTVVAGTGAVYTPVPPAGSTTQPAIHGTAPGDGGPATASGVQFNSPSGIAVDSLGNLYITDMSGPVRRVDTQGVITTFAGGIAAGKGSTTICPGGTDTSGDGCPANEASFKADRGIVIDPATADIYIADGTGNAIRKISHSTYLISQVVGTGSKGAANGSLATATLNGPRGVAMDKHGNLYIADAGNSAVRVANFTASTVSTVANIAVTKATLATCTTSATATTAGAANMGLLTDIAFDGSDNLYVADSTCGVVFKLAENPATGVVDSGSTISVVAGSGGTGTQAVFTNVPANSVVLTPGSVKADLQGNLYIGENTGTHVWFLDAATSTMHTIFGGGTPGDCFGAVGSGTAPYNGCDGIHSSLSTSKGFIGLALDAWGNLYISDAMGYVHKLALGTSAPASPVGGNNGNALLHFGAGDSYGSVNMSAAPDFTFTKQSCVTNTSSDDTQDCGILVTSTTPSSTSVQYEQATVRSTLGKTSTIYLTNQAVPTCQGAVTANVTTAILNPTNVTLSSQPGAACSGVETIVAGAHKYTYAVTTSPANGTIGGTAPNVTYTANTGYTGSDSFIYSVTDLNTYAGAQVSYDGNVNSITLEAPSPQQGSFGTVTLQPYTPPVATPQSVTVSYNTAKSITLTGTDSDNTPLNFAIAAQPTHGTLSGSGGNITYTPTTNYAGTDSFTFTGNDNVATSPAATVSITVNPPAPVAPDQNVSVSYQTATAITLAATGQGTITYSVATQPTHGTLSGTAPTLTYTPGNSYSGVDTFTYAAANAGGSTVGTIHITVGTPPATPVAQSRTASVNYNTVTPITAIAGGGTGTLIYSVVSAPVHGGLGAFSGNSITYTPVANYSGPDSFTFKVTDGTNTSNTATIAITVNPPSPVASNQNVTTPFQTAAAVTLAATGPGTITYSVVTQPAHGTLSGTAPNLTYTPTSTYAGSDSFTFKANNGTDSNTATVSITVSAPPAPVAANPSITVPYNAQQAVVTLSATGLSVSYVVKTPPAHGTLAGTGQNLTYTPTNNYFGSDSFTFTASNPGGNSDGTVSITVLPPPPVPQAQFINAAFQTATPITLVATGTGPFTYSVASNPSHGSLTLSGAVATYTPNTGYTGGDSFSFKANNGTNSASSAQVSIIVLPPPPTANGAPLTVNYNTAANLTLTSSEIGISPIAYAIATQPAHGTVVLNGTVATYTPATFYAGADSFTFTATNAGGTSTPATISVTVTGGFQWTLASGQTTVTVNAGEPATYNLTVAGWSSSAGVQATLSCTGGPIVCTFNPNPVTLNGTTPVPVTATFMTTQTFPSGIGATDMRSRWVWLNLLWLLVLAPLALRRRMRFSAVIILLAMVFATAGMSGCGGNIPEHAFGTASGTYNMSIIATSGAAQTSFPVTIIVP